MEKIVIGSNNDKYFQVRVQLPLAKKEELVVFLKNNLNIFAWNMYEASRMDPKLICHHLNVNHAITLRRQ